MGVFVVALCAMPGREPTGAGQGVTVAEPTARQLDFSARVSAEEVVRGLLKDPDSARFGEEYVISAKAPLVCGWVNAKNSFGAYEGATQFIVFGAGATLRNEDNDRKFVRLWNRGCTAAAQRKAAGD